MKVCIWAGIALAVMSVASNQVGADQAALRINSITFSAASPLKAGDVITVDLSGTPGTKAAFAVRNLISATQLAEVTAGCYHGTATVPNGKSVKNAPLVGYLGDKNRHAAPVQASRLISVVASGPMEPPTLPVLAMVHKPVAPPKPATTPAPKPVPALVAAAAPKPAPASVAPSEPAKIAIETPLNGGVLKHTIMLKGSAEPGSTVHVQITYSNGLSGLLKLSGEVTSQDLAVGKDGKFRLGPVGLEGPLATDGLKFTIKAYYPNRQAHDTAEIVVTGKRE